MMKYAFVYNGQIFLTYLPEAIPTGVEYLIVDDNIEVFDLVIEDGQLRLKTEEERLNELKQRKVQNLKSYVSSLLSQTDWVVIKLQSLVNEGWSKEEIQAEKEKYKEILEQRRRIREWNRQMEQTIQNAQTLEELERIRIEFVE